MTPLDHLHEAHGLLTATRAHWHTAETNLRWLQGDGLPTGHQATARLDNDQDPPPDECRTALAEARRLMHEILAHYSALIGQRLARPDDLGILLHACCRWWPLAWATVASHDVDRETCRQIHQAAIELHRLAHQWAKARPWRCDQHGQLGCATCNGIAHRGDGVGLTTRDWCSHHARYRLFEPAVTDDGLCDFCATFTRNDPRNRKPPLSVLQKRHEGQRLTVADIEGAA